MSIRDRSVLVVMILSAAVAACMQDDSGAAARAPSASALYANPNYCTKCHGGLDNGTGAPPNDLAGNGATSFMSVGAHSAHVAAGPMAVALDCSQCHPPTANLCAPTHVNGTVDIAWGPIPTSHGTVPSFDATSGTCANWCHGATMQNGTRNQPTWTGVGQGQAACGTCHGIPTAVPGSPGQMTGLPSANHPAFLQGTRCMDCHQDTMTVNAMGQDVLKPGGGDGHHVNGVVDALAHGAGWYVPVTGGTHAQNVWNGLGPLTMDAYYAQCTRCHGNGSDFLVSGGWSGVSCGTASCHSAFFITTQPVGQRCGGITTVPCTSCVFCH